MAAKVTLAEFEDWQVLYVDEKPVLADHRIDLLEGLDAIGRSTSWNQFRIEVDSFWVAPDTETYDWMQETGQSPELSAIPEEERTH